MSLFKTSHYFFQARLREAMRFRMWCDLLVIGLKLCQLCRRVLKVGLEILYWLCQFCNNHSLCCIPLGRTLICGDNVVHTLYMYNVTDPRVDECPVVRGKVFQTFDMIYSDAFPRFYDCQIFCSTSYTVCITWAKNFSFTIIYNDSHHNESAGQ